MTYKRYLFISIFIISFVLGLGFFLWHKYNLFPNTHPYPLLNQPFPAFKLPLLEQPDRIITNNDLLGKPFLVNVWGSWCSSCRKEHKNLLDFASRHQLDIIGINSEDRPPALKWLESQGSPYVFNLHDKDNILSDKLDVIGVPESYLIDAKGIILFKHSGILTSKVWDKIQALLKT